MNFPVSRTASCSARDTRVGKALMRFAFVVAVAWGLVSLPYGAGLFWTPQAQANHPITEASRLTTQADQYRRKGRYAEAEDLYRQALAIREKRLGRNHPLVASTLGRLADVYRIQRRYA
ncbi:MAG: tetratricopeptide repeat protein, partial [Hyphomicrobiaceae bacterium]